MNPAKRILIVDDESDILILLELLLTAEGYEVVTTTDGDEANQLSRSQRFDLILVDLIMPIKDGIETILSLRASRVKAPIIAMSGGWLGGTKSCLPLAEKLGASGTLAKPFDRETLLRTVVSVLGTQGAVTPHFPQAARPPATALAACG